MSRYSSVQKYNPLELVVDTTIAGASGVGNFQLPIRGNRTYRYYIEWGDGITSASTSTTSLTHTYSSSGIYTVKAYGRLDDVYFFNSTEADKILDILSWGNIKYKSLYSAFRGSANLTGLTTTSWQSVSMDPSTTPPIGGGGNEANLQQTFMGCTNLNTDMGAYDVSNTKRLTWFFLDCDNFNNGGSPSISGWTTSNVQYTDNMFTNSAFNQPIGSWDVSNVTNMSRMFRGASFSGAVGSWDVSNVTNTTSMFEASDYFNQDIGSWDTSSLVNCVGMFFNNAIFNNGGSPSISGWTMSGVTSLQNMFRSCPTFNQPIGSWDTSNNTKLIYTFFGNFGNFNQDIGSWDVSKVTSMVRTFYGINHAFNNGGSPSISAWTTTSCSDFTETFSFSDFNQPIGSWDVSNATTMDSMLQNTNFNQDISNWNVSGVTNMSDMLDNTPMSQANYDSILTGWTGWNGSTATKTLQSNVNFGADGLNYTSGGTVEAARNYLITGLTWTITDAGGI